MRIGVVTQWFPPEPAFVQGALCKQLAGRGHEVRVLTGFPNYPSGRVYPGYRQRIRHVEHSERLIVRRVPLYPSHDGSALRRAANYLSFGAAGTTVALRHLSGCDAMYVYHPPVTAFPAADLVRRVDGTPVVLHVQDIWPDNVANARMAPKGRSGRFIRRAVDDWMRRAYRISTSVIVIGPAMRDLLIERGVEPGKVYTVLNWTDETLFRPVPATEQARRELGYRQRCTVMYAGNLGHFQGLEVAVRAAAAVRDTVDLVVVGSGTEEAMLHALADRLGADNVRFLGRRDPADMACLYAAADFQLVCWRDLPNLRGAIPSKLPAALACGCPVIASDGGDGARIVADSGAGIVCRPEDWRALADGFVEAARLPVPERSAMSRRARQAYQARMSMRVGVEQIEKVLLAAAESRPRGRRHVQRAARG